MATFVIAPKYGVKKNVRARILTAGLGDGYKQRAADGINTMPETWALTWTRKTDDIDIIETFFETHAGHVSFDWIPPRQTTSKKFICTKWSRTIDSFLGDSITATFEQSWEY